MPGAAADSESGHAHTQRQHTCILARMIKHDASAALEESGHAFLLGKPYLLQVAAKVLRHNAPHTRTHTCTHKATWHWVPVSLTAEHAGAPQ